jgi:DNA-binding YbaB/EbfC family protein
MTKPSEKPNEKMSITEMMKSAQEMQKRLGEIQKQVAETVITGQAGGMIEIKVTGTHYAKEVKLDPNLLKEAKSVIEDLIAAAINDATDKIEKKLREKMVNLTGMKLPDSFSEASE